MRDVTQLFDHYRISARAVWNTAFWSQTELRNTESWDRFERVKESLFEALVLARLRDEGSLPQGRLVSLPVFHVAPRVRAPIMVSRPRVGDPKLHWDDPLSRISPSDADLHFLDYFDLGRMRYADFQYYRVRIAQFEAHPDLVGRDALIERLHASVLVALNSHRA